jgi:hypothetical protein
MWNVKIIVRTHDLYLIIYEGQRFCAGLTYENWSEVFEAGGLWLESVLTIKIS